jgi:hypothetical protein
MAARELSGVGVLRAGDAVGLGFGPQAARSRKPRAATDRKDRKGLFMQDS